jgi:nicotinamidase-related amidase
MRQWEKVVPSLDREIFQKAGFNKPESFRGKPAILLVDIVESFTGTRLQPVIEAIDEHPVSCGESAWIALPKIKELISVGRKANVPIIYTKGDAYQTQFCGGPTKLDREDKDLIRKVYSTPIVKMIEPEEGDLIIHKTKASAFFSTVLDLYLKKQEIDSILVGGTSTSGCVRATVVDGISHGYRMFVIEECCFDRSEFFHLVSLFDMNAKYATVISFSEASVYLTKNMTT